MPNELSRIIAEMLDRGGRMIISPMVATKGEMAIIDGGPNDRHSIVFYDDEDVQAFLTKMRGGGVELGGKLR